MRGWPLAGVRALASRSHASQDLFFGALAALLWGGNALKMAPLCSAATNVQLALGMLAICGISLAWPLLGPDSYQRWRVAALAALRLFLICLPVNFNTGTFDALAPAFVSGRFSWIANPSLLFTSSHLDMLLFMALGWRLPLRVHMPLQAASIAILLRFGLPAHLNTKLWSSPDMAWWASCLHRGMAFLTELFLPAGALIVVPEDTRGQAAALLSFCWLMAGWLLPTLLLLRPNQPRAAVGQPIAAAPEAASGSRHRLGQHLHVAGGSTAGSPAACHTPLRRLWAAAAAAAAWVGDCTEAGLEFLVGAPLSGPSAMQSPRTQQQSQQPQRHGAPAAARPAAGQAERQAALGALDGAPTVSLLPRWLPLIIGTWMACCAVTPMLGRAPGF
ncbi:hypothetical protein ABPG77_010180 [Micractinium sp. CCAP 211/92]